MIDEKRLEISCSQWHPGDEEWVATVTVSADLSPVMPYVNAESLKPEYHPSVPVIVWRDGEHQVALRPHEIAVNHLVDSAAAEKKMREVIAWINGLWERRHEITPDFEPRTPPPLMSVLKLLPRDGCRRCALPTCTAFAARLIDGEKRIEDCPALLSEGGEGSAQKLRGMGLS